MNAEEALPRCGDTVKHMPTGEIWLVAFADPDTKYLAPAGWPDSRAELSDCEIVRRCSDLEHVAAVTQWETVENDTRRGSVLRLYGHALPVLAKESAIPIVFDTAVDLAEVEHRIEAYVAGPAPRILPLAPKTHAGVVEERNRLRRCLVTQARMLACWAPECFPTLPNGKVHFARALMESAAKEMTDTLDVPYPIEDEQPEANPVSGMIGLLKRVEHTLTLLNGVYARDTDLPGPLAEWQVDVAAELVEISAALASLRSIPAYS